jgi:hypothetical protein
VNTSADFVVMWLVGSVGEQLTFVISVIGEQQKWHINPNTSYQNVHVLSNILQMEKNFVSVVLFAVYNRSFNNTSLLKHFLFNQFLHIMYM